MNLKPSYKWFVAYGCHPGSETTSTYKYKKHWFQTCEQQCKLFRLIHLSFKLDCCVSGPNQEADARSNYSCSCHNDCKLKTDTVLCKERMKWSARYVHNASWWHVFSLGCCTFASHVNESCLTFLDPYLMNQHGGCKAANWDANEKSAGISFVSREGLPFWPCLLGSYLGDNFKKASDGLEHSTICEEEFECHHSGVHWGTSRSGELINVSHTFTSLMEPGAFSQPPCCRQIFCSLC